MATEPVSQTQSKTIATRVSVIVPCLNEAPYVRSFLTGLRRQSLSPGIELEVILADGGSEDGTREVLREYASRHSQIRLLDNPRRIVSTGLNRAIQAATGSIIIRMDVHTRYASDYVAQCVRALRTSSADNVGGPWAAEGTGYISEAVALVFDSWLVSGGGRAHSKTYEGPVDTVYLGCWRKETFEKCGLFDESLVRSQDNELNLRIRRLGGTVWQTPRIRSWYTPRSSLKSLFKQYTQYGYWKARVIRKHRLPASPRQLVPGAFVATLLALAGAGLVSEGGRSLLVLLSAGYGLAVLLGALGAYRGPGTLRLLPVLPLVFGSIHLGYGYGFLRGFLDFYILRRRGNASFSVQTRPSQTT